MDELKEQIAILEKENAELKRQLEKRPFQSPIAIVVESKNHDKKRIMMENELCIKRIGVLIEHLQRLRKEITLVNPVLQDIYKELEDAFKKAITTEATFLIFPK